MGAFTTTLIKKDGSVEFCGFDFIQNAIDYIGNLFKQYLPTTIDVPSRVLDAVAWMNETYYSLTKDGFYIMDIDIGEWVEVNASISANTIVNDAENNGSTMMLATTKKTTYLDTNQKRIGVIVGSVVGIVIVLAAVIAVIVATRQKKKQRYVAVDLPTHEVLQ